MTPDELYEALRATDSGDTEATHCAADKLLLDTLRSLGYGKACDQFEALDKWYA